jgi:hypothetical protein
MVLRRIGLVVVAERGKADMWWINSGYIAMKSQIRASFYLLGVFDMKQIHGFWAMMLFLPRLSLLS